MTFDVSQISTLNPSSQNCVSTANGNAISIIREGSTHLTNTLHHDSVLVVPSLDFNLLSVSQITSTISCVVIFWPNHCVFKDIQTRQTISYGVKSGKLYYLDLDSKTFSRLRQALAIESMGSPKKIVEIWLWHRLLGHASFGYLKRLFPGLFMNLDISIFKCGVCELAKSHRASFPVILNKSPVPFMVIHSDVWGPCKVPTLGRSH